MIHGADINAVNNLEETPLVTFIKRGSSFATVEYVSFLVENGANPNISADGINSALLEAISFPSIDVAWVLIDAKANVNHIGNNGNTALHAVFSKGINLIYCHVQIIKIFSMLVYILSILQNDKKAMLYWFFLYHGFILRQGS